LAAALAFQGCDVAEVCSRLGLKPKMAQQYVDDYKAGLSKDIKGYDGAAIKPAEYAGFFFLLLSITLQCAKDDCYFILFFLLLCSLDLFGRWVCFACAFFLSHVSLKRLNIWERFENCELTELTCCVKIKMFVFNPIGLLLLLLEFHLSLHRVQNCFNSSRNITIHTSRLWRRIIFLFQKTNKKQKKKKTKKTPQ
jgi:hypothetical protein